MFMTPVESLAPWVLFLEGESYLSYIKKMIKKMLPTTDTYSTILKNWLQKALDNISENKSATIKKIEQF